MYEWVFLPRRKEDIVMRVIAGSARSLKLKTIEGMDTRPTTDRIKETLFNMIAHYGILDVRFLDLFSGSGGIGIEALSRGAKEAVFVERNPAAVACIQDNLNFTRLKERARVLKMDVFAALKNLEREAPFDYIFMDPPYGHDLEKRALQYLSDSRLVNSDTLIIVEASAETDFSYLTGLGFCVTRQKNYKTNMHLFIKRAGKEELC
jgi:16S rRNA (guanine966-N2)-methyltransferase